MNKTIQPNDLFGLLRRGYEVHIGQVSDGEIDFVATRQENKLYIQIAQQIDSVKTEQREGEYLIQKEKMRWFFRSDFVIVG